MVKNLRESVIKDVLDVIDGVKDVIDNGVNKSKRPGNALSVSSLSKASKDLIMSFPVLCDNSIDPRTASMICKAVERKAVTMLQLLFASCTFSAANARDIISNWHNNIDNGDMNLDDYLDLCDDISSRFESTKMSTTDLRAIKEAENNIKLELRNGCKSYPISSFAENSINDYKVNVRYGKTVVMEAPIITGPGPFSSDKGQQLGKALDTDTQFFVRQLMDNDVKKCNELVPSLMIIRFVTPVEGTHEVVHNQCVAGVKARLIPVDSYDIIDRINTKNKDRAGLMNFIRATTKEISFVKDYLLAIDKAKIEAKRNSIKNGGNSKIWKILEKRATKSVWKRLIGRSNDASCITTLVLSQQIVNVLKKEYGVNMADVKTASAIMDAYNLLCVCIVDESTEVARFLYDGDDWYEDLSFNTLERESGDGSYKKVINLLSKMNRG